MRACLFLLGPAVALAQNPSSTWHFLDVTQVVCPGTPGEIEVELSLEGLNGSQPEAHAPHILSLFRVSQQAVNLTYRFTDSAAPTNHTIDSRTVQLAALSNSSRRLRGFAFGEGLKDDGEEDEEADTATEDEEEQEVSHEHTPRMLGGKGGGWARAAARRRGGGGGGFGTGARRRGFGGGAAAGARRRAAPAQTGSRRRTAPAQTGSRRRTYGAGGSRWGNSQSPGVGNYGYTSQASLNHNFGGRPPLQTPYGYSGANAYRPGGGMGNIALAVGGGLLAGAVASHLFGRWSRGRGLGRCTCPSCGTTVYDSCEECRRLNPGRECVATAFGLPVSAARDDLMSTGFIPADRTGPLRLRISGIQGADFLPEVVCPPAGWNPGTFLENGTNATNISWAPSGKQAIFVTLTRLDALGTPGRPDPASGGFGLPAGMAILAALAGGCLLLACVGAACARKRAASW